MEAPSERPPDRARWRSGFGAVAASLSALLGLAGGIGFGGYLWASSKVDPIPITLPDDPSATTAVLGRCAARECNYLLLGSGSGGGSCGGPQLVAEAVQELTGIRIHHVLYVNLAGFENFVDAMGGVPMCVDRPLFDERTGPDIPEAGCYEFTGFPG